MFWNLLPPSPPQGPPSLDTPSAPVHPTEVPWDKVTEELDSSPLLTYSDFLHETFADETGGVSNPRMMKEARDDRKVWYSACFEPTDVPFYLPLPTDTPCKGGTRLTFNSGRTDEEEGSFEGRVWDIMIRSAAAVGLEFCLWQCVSQLIPYRLTYCVSL